MSNDISPSSIYESGTYLDFSVDSASSVGEKSFHAFFFFAYHIHASFILFVYSFSGLWVLFERLAQLGLRAYSIGVVLLHRGDAYSLSLALENRKAGSEQFIPQGTIRDEIQTYMANRRRFISG